jgi:hypothetical protein
VKYTVNPHTTSPKFPITVESSSLSGTHTYDDLAHIEGNLEEFREDHDSYRAHDADGKPLLLVVDAMNIVLFRLRETEKTAYEAVSPKGSEYPRWMFEKDGETIIRCVTFGVGGKATGLPKQFDEEATLEISEDVESVQSDYAAFEHAWNQSR